MKHGLFAFLFFVGVQGLEVRAQEKLEKEETSSGEAITHTVVEGDTLWKLAETYLGDSGKWPAVWGANEHIENPNWIYPGEVVVLRPGLLAKDSGPAADLSPALEPPEEAGAGLARLMERPADLPAVVSIGTLITPGPIEGWGVIESSLTQAQMLSPLDEVSIQVKRDSPARPGETFLILRSLGKIKHPKTKKLLGYATQVVGAVQLQTLEGRRGRARIVRASAEILRGDMLGPLGESNLRPVYSRKNDKTMEAWVVGVEEVRASIAGVQHVVFVDKGSADGVAPGNRFYIMRQQDGLQFETVLNPAFVQKGLERQAVGVCTLVDVKSTVSSCLLTWASREVVAGDRVEMREEG